MSITAFNRARRQAAERSGQTFEEVSFTEAVEILRQPAAAEPEAEPEPKPKPTKAKPKPAPKPEAE
jgi:hypothetical protein